MSKLLFIILFFQSTYALNIFYPAKKNIEIIEADNHQYHSFIETSLSKSLEKAQNKIPYHEDRMFLDTFVIGISTDIRMGIGVGNTSLSKGMEFHFKVQENSNKEAK